MSKNVRKSEDIFLIYNLQTRTLVLPSAFGYMFRYIQILFPE